ncbi:MAG TPA: hypothetical protein PK079_26400 [Leptospiraceae bacterium]|nr:hypothetical protein [Leptospiraceae bacterium]HNF57511.1 hypothetical protein [Leptospiraceae bacterium]
MDIGLRAEVQGVKAQGYTLGEAIDRVDISYGLVLQKRVGKAQVVVKKARLFDGLSTAFKVKAVLF